MIVVAADACSFDLADFSGILNLKKESQKNRPPAYNWRPMCYCSQGLKGNRTLGLGLDSPEYCAGSIIDYPAL